MSWSGVYWCRLGPDFINQSPGVSPDVFVVRLRILSFFFSPGPNFIKQVRVRVRVWILFISSPDPDSSNTLKSLTIPVIITQYINVTSFQQTICSSLAPLTYPKLNGKGHAQWDLTDLDSSVTTYPVILICKLFSR